MIYYIEHLTKATEYWILDQKMATAFPNILEISPSSPSDKPESQLVDNIYFVVVVKLPFQIKTSLYTMLLVTFLGLPSIFGIANLMQLGEPTLEMQTQSCPWAKQGSFNHTPTFWRVCPWALLIVIANETFTGNCLLFHSKGYSLSFGLREILGINTVLLLCSPPAIVHSRR